MKLFGLTDTGLVRQNNQDSYAIRQPDESLGIVVVCDGMGGARAGNVASAVGVEAFSSALEESCRQGLPPDPERKQELLKSAVRTANGQIYELAEENPEYYGMGTTLVAALILSNEAYIANVGDSRCYHWSEGMLHQISQDHSVVQALVERGEITPEQARTHPRKNLITRALGTAIGTQIDVFRIDYRAGDKLLLCSDGLTNVVTDDVVSRELALNIAPEDMARALLTLAIEQGAPDNVTVVVAQL